MSAGTVPWPRLAFGVLRPGMPTRLMPHATCLEIQVLWLRTEISNIGCGNPPGGLWTGYELETCVLPLLQVVLQIQSDWYAGGPKWSTLWQLLWWSTGASCPGMWCKWRQMMPQWGWEGDHPSMAFTQKWPQHVNPQCCCPNWKGNYPKTKAQWKDSLTLIKSQKAWSQQMHQPGVKHSRKQGGKQHSQPGLLPFAAGVGYFVQLTLGMS